MVDDSKIAISAYYGRNVKNQLLNEPSQAGTGQARASGGYVYFVTCERSWFPIKIGFAKSVPNRMRALLVGFPYEIKLLAVIRGDRALERELHARFAQWRLSGEWFDRTPALTDYIARLDSSEYLADIEALRAAQPDPDQA